MSHWRCCCGGGAPSEDCCGCGSCPSTLTLTAVVTYRAAWQGGGSCDLAYNVTSTTVMTLTRVAQDDGQCDVPPATALECDHCQWQVGAGSTNTFERPWENACAGADEPTVVTPIGGDVGADPGEFGGLKCGTCYIAPASAATFILRARAAGGGTFFEATGDANDSTLCPGAMTWTVVTPTGPPDLTPLWIAEDWNLEWSLT